MHEVITYINAHIQYVSYSLTYHSLHITSKIKSGKIIETSVESIVPLMNGKMNLSYILFDYGIGY